MPTTTATYPATAPSSQITAASGGVTPTIITGWVNADTGPNADDGTNSSSPAITAKNGTAAAVTRIITINTTDLPAAAGISLVTLETEDQVTGLATGTFRLKPRLGTTVGSSFDHTSSTTLTARSFDITAGRPGGGSWAPADFNGGTLRIETWAIHPNSTTAATYAWDYVRVFVTYTVPPPDAPLPF